MRPLPLLCGLFSVEMLLSVFPIQAQQTPVKPSSPSAHAGTAPPSLQRVQSLKRISLAGCSAATQPLNNYERILLMRNDVKRELNLNGRQREQLQAQLLEMHTQVADAVNSKILNDPQLTLDVQKTGPIVITGPDGIQTQISVSPPGTFRPGSDEFNIAPAAPVVPSPDLTPQQKQEFEAKREALRVLQEQAEQKPLQTIKAALSLAQKQRLRQLDLQWRGVFSLTDKGLAQEAGVSEAQRQILATQLHQFQQQSDQITGDCLKTINSLQESFKTATPEARVALFEQAATRREPFQKKYQQACLRAEEKALMALSSAQQQRWQVMTGRPFLFRQVD